MIVLTSTLSMQREAAKGIVKFRDVEKQTIKEQDTVRAAAQREHRETRTGQTEIAFEQTPELSTPIQQERIRRLQDAELDYLGFSVRDPSPTNNYRR